MTWADTALPAVGLWTTLVLPGWAVLRALGLRGLLALGAAPAVTSALVGVLGVIYPALGLRWNLATAAAGLAVGVGAACAAGVLLGTVPRRGADEPPRPWRPPPLPRRAAGLLTGSLALAVVLVVVPMARGTGSPDSPAQAWDAVFHLNGIASVRTTGDASTFGGLAPLYGGRAVYYPAVWHALVAVAPGLGPPTVAANVAVLVAGGPIWLVGVAAFTRAVVPERVLPVLVAPVLASTFVAYPVVVLTQLAQEPMGLSLALLPGALGMIVVALRSPWRRWTAGACVLAPAAAVAGVVLAHGSGLFSLLVLGGPPTVVSLVRRARQAWAAGNRAAVLTGVGVAVLAVAAVAVGLATFPAFLTTLAYERDGAGSYLPSFVKLLTDTPQVLWYGAGAGNAVVTALAVAGAVTTVRRREGRWLLAAVALAAVLVLLAAGPPANPLRVLTGVWYTQAARIAPLVVLPAVVLAATAFAGLADRMGARVAAASRRRLPGWVVPLSLLLAVVVLTAGARWDLKTRIAGSVHAPGPIVWGSMLSDAELAMIERLPERLPEDAVVLGDPFNGSAYLPALADVDVVFPQLGPMPGEDREVLELSFRRLRHDPDVCRAVKALGVTHVYVDTAGADDGARVDERTAGLRRIDTSEGFELVDRGGTASLWRLTACA